MKYATSTVAADGTIVPWLAASGLLAFSPDSPPENDYVFQYGWTVPGVFHPELNKRGHYWFGSRSKTDPEVRLLFEFWHRARTGDVDAVYIRNGSVDVSAGARSPLAVYRHPGRAGAEHLVLMQHGSYQICDFESQPLVDRGEAVIYRGVQDSDSFLLHRLTTRSLRERLARVHARTLIDSVISFNTVHCNLVRCETTLFNDRTFSLDRDSRETGLDPASPPIRSVLYSGYTLNDWCARWKFGPNFVKFRTPFTNLRLTTFVCGEAEIKVIDPNQIEVVEASGCQVQEVYV